MQLKKGIKLLEDIKGKGNIVERKKHYILSIRITLNKGDIVATPNKCLSHTVDENSKVHEDGFFQHQVRIDRENLVSGIFYTVESMRVGGFRKVIISPHLAYGEKGIPGVIPENAKLIVEVYILSDANNIQKINLK